MEHTDIILGIESSCDDTSAAVIKDGYLLSNVIASQQVHKDYGGVVPELASRAHEQNIVPVVSQALEKAGEKALHKAPGEELRRILSSINAEMFQKAEGLVEYHGMGTTC